MAASRKSERSGMPHHLSTANAISGPSTAPGVVGRAVESVRAAADLRCHGVRDERIARRGADPLPHPVGDADRRHLRHALRESNERAHEAREPVAEDHERLAALHAVGDPPARELEQCGDGLRRALDRADRAGARAEHGGEEERHERVDHLTGDVGEEARRREGDDVAAELGRRYLEIATPHGMLPAGIRRTILNVAASITLTLFDGPFAV